MLPWHTRWAGAGSGPRGSTVGGSEVECSAVLPIGASLFCFMTRGLTPTKKQVILSSLLTKWCFAQTGSCTNTSRFAFTTWLAVLLPQPFFQTFAQLDYFNSISYCEFFFFFLCQTLPWTDHMLLLQVSNPPGLVS